MVLFFYNLALIVVLAASAPWWLWRMATTHKYRQGLAERLGFVRRKLTRCGAEARSQADLRPVIWLPVLRCLWVDRSSARRASLRT